jgi:hypothetical protein
MVEYQLYYQFFTVYFLDYFSLICTCCWFVNSLLHGPVYDKRVVFSFRRGRVGFMVINMRIDLPEQKFVSDGDTIYKQV